MRLRGFDEIWYLFVDGTWSIWIDGRRETGDFVVVIAILKMHLENGSQLRSNNVN